MTTDQRTQLRLDFYAAHPALCAGDFDGKSAGKTQDIAQLKFNDWLYNQGIEALNI